MNKQFTVGELNDYANTLLSKDAILSNVSVKGEISGYKNHFSGHRYFSMKDKEGKIDCVMFSSSAKNLRFEPKDGDAVIATGQVGVFKRDGKYQLYVRAMELENGMGDLYEKYLELKDKLFKEGLFDEDHKKKLPLLPRKIGIVTSSQGAAVQDMINIITRRYSNSYIVIYPAKVQGTNAHLSIMEGIAYFNSDPMVDVIIIGRGGGSLEDLWAFNEEELARAIYASEKPIISAVGHEVDFSISDFVADLRAPTPSAAAELCVPQKADMIRAIEVKKNALELKIKGVISAKRLQVSLEKSKISGFNPTNKINQQRQTVDLLFNQLNSVFNQSIAENKYKCKVLSEKLTALNPKAVLERGYSIIENEDGVAVDSAESLKTNDKVTLVFHDGNVKARVE